MPTFDQVKATAQRAGHTVRVICELEDVDLYGWIKPGAASRDVFTLIDDESGIIYNVKGYHANVRDLDD